MPVAHYQVTVDNTNNVTDKELDAMMNVAEEVARRVVGYPQMALSQHGYVSLLLQRLGKLASLHMRVDTLLHGDESHIPMEILKEYRETLLELSTFAHLAVIALEDNTQ